MVRMVLSVAKVQVGRGAGVEEGGGRANWHRIHTQGVGAKAPAIFCLDQTQTIIPCDTREQTLFGLFNNVSRLWLTRL